MTDHKTNGISRRSIAKGAAWAAPVIAVAAAAPLAAASHYVPPEPTESASISCKQPGKSGNLSYGYYGLFTIENPTDSPITYTFTSFVAADGTNLSGIQVMPASGSSWTGATSTITVPANSTVSYWIRGYGANSSSTSFTVSYSVGGETFSTQFVYNDMQPCCTGASTACPPGESAVVTSTAATTEKQAAPASTSEASTASATEQAAPTTESAAPASETTVAPATESATATEAPASVSK